MTKRIIVVMMAVILCAAMAQAGTRADLSGDAVVDFQTTMDMPFMAVGNLGNVADTRYATPGYGAVDYVYRMGKFEVTAGQYTEFLNAVAATDTYELYHELMDARLRPDGWYWGCDIRRNGSDGTYTYSVAADWADRPVNYVSWGDAARFANWLTNGMPTGVQDLTTTEDGSYFLNGATSSFSGIARGPDARYVLPAENEWYKAAYHKNDGPTGNYFDYPTSTDAEPSNDLVNPDPGNNANFFIAGMPGDFTVDAPYYRSEAGEFENSESPYGTFDQGGNVWEWTETAISSSRRVVRGGPWYHGVWRLHASHRDYESAIDDDVFVGFRVVDTVPEPATMSLLALGGVTLLRRRKK